jgi:lipopolysaccharide transport system ATP-binding protein
MYFTAHQRIEHPLFGVALHHADGFHICGPNTGSGGYPIEAIVGDGYVDFVIPNLPLLPGAYHFSTAIYDQAGEHAYDHHHQAYTFRVTESEQTTESYGTVQIPSYWRLSARGAPEASESVGRDATR